MTRLGIGGTLTQPASVIPRVRVTDDRTGETERMPITNEKAGARLGAGLLAACASGVALAQPPAATDAELPESRRIPAEQRAAAYSGPDWTAPRTSWGDPSLEGTWSTDDMRGIPRNRPEELGTQEFLTGDQFLERAREQHAGRERAVNEETFLRNEWGTRTFGFTSLVVDPPDGRWPPLNEAGRARARATAGRGTAGPGPFDDFDDFSLYDRCISLGISRGMGAAIYGNGIRIASFRVRARSRSPTR